MQIFRVMLKRARAPVSRCDPHGLSGAAVENVPTDAAALVRQGLLDPSSSWNCLGVTIRSVLTDSSLAIAVSR